MQPWFETNPQRLEHELEELRKAGYSFTQNEKARANGHVVLNIEYPIDGQAHSLAVIFPDNYPYFPIEIYAPTFPAGRHKAPDTGLLCLFAQKEWSTGDTVAGIISSQVQAIYQAHRHPDEAADIEAQEATQVTGYFLYQPSTLVFTGKWEIPPEHQHGELLIGLDPGANPDKELRGAVLEVRAASGDTLVRLDDLLSKRYQKTVIGRWVRLDTAPSRVDIGNLLGECIKAWPILEKPVFKKSPDILGVLFPEETSYKHYEDNWVFAVRFKDAGLVKAYLARADRFSRDSYLARVPRLSPVANKKVLVVGLGSVGSVCAWQLARAGVGQLNVLDYDHLQFGNLPRWLMGFNAIGASKAGFLTQRLATHYPFVQVKGFHHRIGSNEDCKLLTQALEGVDLILDATAEWCVGHYLSDLAKLLKIPYVWATGTTGSYGGVIGRVIPDQTQGCWKCFQRHLAEGKIKTPHQENTADVQPVGCFHPTFTGTGFDMDHVSLAAVRLVISTLCSGQDAAYPDFDWDVGVVDLWNEANTPIAPTWETYPLMQHSHCDGHK